MDDTGRNTARPRDVVDESAILRRVRRLLGRLPVGVGITGPRRDLVLELFDAVFAPSQTDCLTRIETTDDRQFDLRLEAPTQRLLACCYHNVMRHFRHTPLFELLHRRAPDGDASRWFVDVGANLGWYSLLAGRLGYRTLVVEPDPLHARFLDRHTGYFNRVRAVAVGEEHGSTRLFVAGDTNRGASSLVDKSGNSELYETERQVPVVPLHRLLSELSVPDERVDVVKIDVEGHETAAIRGLRPFLDAGNRPLVWTEVRGPSSDRNPGSHRRVTTELAEFGYHPFRFEGRPVPFEPAETELPAVFDLMYRPRDARARSGPNTAPRGLTRR